MKNRKSLSKFMILVSIVALALIAVNFQSASANDDDNGDAKTSHIELSGVAPGTHTVVQWQESDRSWHDVEGWRATATSDIVRWTVEEKDFEHGPFRWISYDASGAVTGISSSFMLPRTNETTRVILYPGSGGTHIPVAYPEYQTPATPHYEYIHTAPPAYSYEYPVQYHYSYEQVQVTQHQQTYQQQCPVQPSYPYGHDAYGHDAYGYSAYPAYDYGTSYYPHGYYSPYYQHPPVEYHHGYPYHH